MIELAPIFTNGMILQRDRKVSIWGWEDNGTEVFLGAERRNDAPGRRNNHLLHGHDSQFQLSGQARCQVVPSEQPFLDSDNPYCPFAALA